MRLRSVSAIVIATFFILFLVLRHHIRDLAEVVRTYSTFYPYLAKHPETLYKYSSSQESTSENDQAHAVPQIIHQIFLTEGRVGNLAKYEAAITSCQQFHPNWTHNLWTDESASAFIAQQYPDILPHYKGYKQSIQRANILRYALLDHFGGVYLDLDVTCLQSLEDLRHLSWLTPGAHPAGVNNAFILSRPHHKFLRHLLEGVPSRDLFWGLPYVENMLSTGCMFFSNRWMSYVRSLEQQKSDIPEDGKVQILADKSGDLAPHMLRGVVTTPLFHHAGASSWHGWDAAAIVLIGAHYHYFLAMMGLGALCGIVLVGVMLRRRAENARGFRAWHGRRSIDKRDSEESMIGFKEG